MANVSFDDLKGKTLSKITGKIYDNQLIFETVDGDTYCMCHHQDCCESVNIEDITGDLDDLIGSEILVAKESVRTADEEGFLKTRDDSDTWTFYKLATFKGYVDIRWHGSSNGYYSESVSFFKL